MTAVATNAVFKKTTVYTYNIIYTVMIQCDNYSIGDNYTCNVQNLH